MATIKAYDNKESVFITDFTFSDTSFNLGELPVGAVVTDIKVFVETAFNSATSDSLKIGTSDDDDYFETAIDLQSTGDASLTLLKQLQVVSSTEATTLTGAVTSVGGSLSAGVGHIAISYIQI